MPRRRPHRKYLRYISYSIILSRSRLINRFYRYPSLNPDTLLVITTVCTHNCNCLPRHIHGMVGLGRKFRVNYAFFSFLRRAREIRISQEILVECRLWCNQMYRIRSGGVANRNDFQIYNVCRNIRSCSCQKSLSNIIFV